MSVCMNYDGALFGFMVQSFPELSANKIITLPMTAAYIKYEFLELEQLKEWKLQGLVTRIEFNWACQIVDNRIENFIRFFQLAAQIVDKRKRGIKAVSHEQALHFLLI